MRPLLLIILILLLIGAFPPMGFAPGAWGYYPFGGLGLVLVILLILLLLGQI